MPGASTPVRPGGRVTFDGDVTQRVASGWGISPFLWKDPKSGRGFVRQSLMRLFEGPLVSQEEPARYTAALHPSVCRETRRSVCAAMCMNRPPLGPAARPTCARVGLSFRTPCLSVSPVSPTEGDSSTQNDIKVCAPVSGGRGPGEAGGQGPGLEAAGRGDLQPRESASPSPSL